MNESSWFFNNEIQEESVVLTLTCLENHLATGSGILSHSVPPTPTQLLPPPASLNSLPLPPSRRATRAQTVEESPCPHDTDTEIVVALSLKAVTSDKTTGGRHGRGVRVAVCVTPVIPV